MNSKGNLYVIMGPSGAGKGSVISKLLDVKDDAFLSISATTRKPRDGEIHGKHYLFVSQEEFDNMVKNDMLLEYATYVGNSYGTPKEPVLRELAKGRDVILEIDVQGAAKIKQKIPEANLLFIVPPTFGEIEKRLRGRDTEDESKVIKRLERAKEEYLFAKSADYVIINDTLDSAVDEILTIMRANSYRTQNRIDFLKF